MLGFNCPFKLYSVPFCTCIIIQLLIASYNFQRSYIFTEHNGLSAGVTWGWNTDSRLYPKMPGRLWATECRTSNCKVSGNLTCDNSPSAVTPMGKPICFKYSSLLLKNKIKCLHYKPVINKSKMKQARPCCWGEEKQRSRVGRLEMLLNKQEANKTFRKLASGTAR